MRLQSARDNSFYGCKLSRCSTLAFQFSIFIYGSLLICSQPAKAEGEYQIFDTPRFTLHIGSTNETYSKNSKAVQSEDLANEALETLNHTFEELTRIFKLQPSRKVVLRFLSPEDFTSETGAPSWTNAMYYRGEISIPLNKTNLRNTKDLGRAVRHEYVHAFLAEVTRHRCPAWIDEGIAQLMEGKPNSVLGPALRKWIDKNEAIPLEWLQNGFTMLEDEVVPAAYAQSLFVTRSLVNQYGFKAIRKYLLALRDGESPDSAFQTAFNQKKSVYESKLSEQIKRWSKSSQKHP